MRLPVAGARHETETMTQSTVVMSTVHVWTSFIDD